MAAIHYAAYMGDLITFRELVANGVDIHMKNDTGMSALHFAAQNNCSTMITYLLDILDFEINEVDAKHSSAIHWAIWNNHEQALSFLLARKPDINL